MTAVDRGRVDRVRRKLAHIDDQIATLEQAAHRHGLNAPSPSQTLNNMPASTLANALALQRWRRDYLAGCAAWPDAHLWRRLGEIESFLGPDLWPHRYGLDLSQLPEEQRQAVYEMYLVEIVLGTAPGVS